MPHRERADTHTQAERVPYFFSCPSRACVRSCTCASLSLCAPLPLRGALRVGALRVGAFRVGALRVGALRVGALRVGALRVGALRVGARGACGWWGVRCAVRRAAPPTPPSTKRRWAAPSPRPWRTGPSPTSSAPSARAAAPSRPRCSPPTVPPPRSSLSLFLWRRRRQRADSFSGSPWGAVPSNAPFFSAALTRVAPPRCTSTPQGCTTRAPPNTGCRFAAPRRPSFFPQAVVVELERAYPTEAPTPLPSPQPSAPTLLPTLPGKGSGAVGSASVDVVSRDPLGVTIRWAPPRWTW